MNGLTKRTRLKAVYLTDTERDLLVDSLTALIRQLDPNATGAGSGWSARLAQSYTTKRIADVIELVKAVDAKAT